MDRMPANSVTADFIRNAAADYVSKWIGRPYFWGGDDPMAGFDCSGLIMEVLQAHGIYQRGTDRSANGIFNDFKDFELVKPYKPYAGCLVFWFSPTTKRAVHVAMMIDKFFIVHAAGGGKRTNSLKDAIDQNAYIKKDKLSQETSRRMNSNGQRHKILDPFK
jgi:cell wall-associated NlpC family hydrolase